MPAPRAVPGIPSPIPIPMPIPEPARRGKYGMTQLCPVAYP